MEYLLLLISVIFTTTGQIFQKKAASEFANYGHLQGFGKVRLLFLPQVMVAIGCLAIGTLLWLKVLQTLDVSQAYPFLSLGFVLVLLYAKFSLNEEIPLLRWVGVGVIMLGITLVAQT